MSKSITGIVAWLKNWFYDESEIDGFITTLNNSIGSKLNANLTEANKNLVTNGSGTVVLEDKPVIPDVSGKADKTGGVQQVTDTNAHSHIGTSANATQGAINTAIDSKLSELVDINFVTVVQTLPTASQSTMGKIYLVPSDSTDTNDNYEEYVTIKDGNTYSWEKFGEITDISVAWNDITSNPFNSYSPSDFATDDHSHGDISSLGTFTGSLTSLLSQDTSEEDNGLLYVDGDSTEIKNAQYINANFIKDTVAHSNIGSSANATQDSINNSINTALSNKAPKSHSSSATTYGVGTTSNYGHNKVINDLNHNSFGNGESLSAYQGYVLKNTINGKQDEITSIVLVDKAVDSTGKIIFYTGDEPS